MRWMRVSFDPDIDFLVIWNMLPVPAAHVSNMAMEQHTTSIPWSESSLHTGRSGPPSAGAHRWCSPHPRRRPPGFRPHPDRPHWAWCFEPLVEQAAHGRFPRPRQAGEKIYGSLVFHVLLLSDTAAVPAAPGPALKASSFLKAGLACLQTAGHGAGNPQCGGGCSGSRE